MPGGLLEKQQTERILDIFPGRLQRRMLRKGLNPPTLAKASGVSVSSLGCYLRGERIPRAPQLVLLAQALGASIDQLLRSEKPREAPRFENGNLSPLQKKNYNFVAEKNRSGFEPTCRDIPFDYAHKVVNALVTRQLLEKLSEGNPPWFRYRVKSWK